MSGRSPVIVLGFARSGTTLLKRMLDRNPELAIPTESYFLPQLWDRHGERPNREAFLDDLERLPRLEDWGVTRADVAERLPDHPSFAQAVQAIYRAYADTQGKSRFGDKTPSYLRELDLLERAFPDARYVHLIRDGRDVALSFLALGRRASFNWARPRGVGSIAVQWKREVADARRFGGREAVGRYAELRYEGLVADPESALREVCGVLELDFDPAMLEYHRAPDAGILQDHPRLAEPPAWPDRDWRDRMSPRQVELFETIAGDLLTDLGYERAFPEPSAAARARAATCHIGLGARATSWKAAVVVARKSPAWRLRQAYNRRRFKPGTTP
jgi:Sulfotransferase family